MSDNPMKDFENFARDALYTAVGLGVLGFQKAQVRRREITETWGGKGIDFGQQVRSAGQNWRPPVHAQIEALRPQIEALRPQIDALRPQAEAIGTQLLAATVALRPQIESVGASLADLLKSMDEHAAPVRHEVDARFSEIEGHLPPPARAGFAQLRARAAVQEETLRWIIGLFAPASPSSEESPTSEESPRSEESPSSLDDDAGEQYGGPPDME
jgi:hypothetical protein